MVTTHPTDYGPELSVSELQAQVFRLEGEIERLRAEIEIQRASQISAVNQVLAAEQREAATIERCAQVADDERIKCYQNNDPQGYIKMGQIGAASRIAAAIRALKDS